MKALPIKRACVERDGSSRARWGHAAPRGWAGGGGGAGGGGVCRNIVMGEEGFCLRVLLAVVFRLGLLDIDTALL